jgi:hypothetical protein
MRSDQRKVLIQRQEIAYKPPLENQCRGSLAFVEKAKSELGIKALHREREQVDGTYALRESGEAYREQIDSKNEALRPENTLSWERITELGAT